MIEPYWRANHATLYLGDVRSRLRDLPTRSVHCVVTSPPYWGLRAYLPEDHEHKSSEIGSEPSPDCGTHGKEQCGGCFVCSMVSVFREVRRVMRDDATLWLNLGDTLDGEQMMIPAKVAIALQADGWVLRQDIIWYSPNKMPESVQNRCTKSHEYIFLLAKGSDYYYDSVAIEEETTTKAHKPGNKKLDASRNDHDQMDKVWGESGSKNKRDVWIVSSTGYPGAHFATFSPKLITPCILAGTSEYGVCAECSRPWERVVSKVATRYTGGDRNQDGDCGASPRDRSLPQNRNGITGSLDEELPKRETVGWRKLCGCQTDDVVPATVLDPFVGSGTTVATVLQLGRAGIGIDLSEQYLRENAVPRIEAAMRGERVSRKPAVPVRVAVPPLPMRLE